MAEQLSIRLHVAEVFEDYIPAVMPCRHGYGANVNPCLDCKSLIVARARAWIAEHGDDFIFIGEMVDGEGKSQSGKKLQDLCRSQGSRN